MISSMLVWQTWGSFLDLDFSLQKSIIDNNQCNGTETNNRKEKNRKLPHDGHNIKNFKKNLKKNIRLKHVISHNYLKLKKKNG